MASKPLVFIAHPISGDVERNVMLTAVWMRWAILEAKVDAVAPYIGLLKALRERVPVERNIGQLIGSRVLAYCDELWLCGWRISKGMQKEAMIAHRLGIPIVDLTGQEKP